MTTNKHPRIFTVLFSIIAGLFIGSTTGIIPVRSPEFTALITLIGVFSTATLAAYPLFNRSESKNSYLIPILLGGIALVLLAILFINVLSPDSIHVELGSEQQTNQTVQASMTQVESYFDTNAFGNWAAWFAAFGTIGTLVFLVNQHHQIRKEQKAQQNELNSERLKREEHERKQQEMWAIQREITSLQTYDAHKKMFHSLLTGLENRFSPLIEFYDKDDLYNNLFPENTPTSCSMVIDVSSESQQSAGTLQDTLVCYEFLEKSLDRINSSSEKEYYTNAHNLIGDLLSLQSSLRIKFKDCNTLGYISPEFDNNLLLVNVFDTTKHVRCLEETLERICAFVSVPPPNGISHKAGGNFIMNTLLSFSLLHTQLRGYNMHFGNYENTLRCMYLCYKFFEKPECRGIEQVTSHSHRLWELFSQRNDLVALLDSKSDLHQLLEEFSLTLESLRKSSTNGEYILHLRDNIREITNQLKPKIFR
ncbi:hypothetical protein [Vibrio splendidus]|uniref:hypothetical protein n=1 Tax=Vibrio splendidus TaxID=29497 RepID=UPI000D3B0E7A|nr:hypothetical protein [Vibrio splendidus]PTO89641.1 hypothetical protein CWO29_12920 [Vibrio splendidus]